MLLIFKRKEAIKPIRFLPIALKPSWIEALSDGLFSIVMALSVIELAVPVVPELLIAEAVFFIQL